MKRNSVLKSIVLSATLSAILTGCGATATDSLGGGKNEKSKDDSLKTTSITGKAVDGYLQYASVCLDLNSDGYCQSSEPMSTTEEDGSFSLDISPQVQKSSSYKDAMLLVYGGRDADTGADFHGKLLAPTDTVAVNVTPITTLVAKAVQEEIKSNPNLTKEQINQKVALKKEAVAKAFGIDVEDVAKDPIALKDTNPKLIKEALKIQKAVEAMADGSGDKDEIANVYVKLAQKLDEVQEDKGIDDLLQKAYADDEKVQKAKTVSENIDIAFDKFDGDLQKVAFVTKEDLKKVRNKEEVTKRESNDELFKVDVEWDEVFIKADLEEIGITEPTEEQIEAIKAEIGDDVQPGEIIKKADDFKEKDDKFFKDIYKQAKKAQAKKEEKKEQEKAKNDSKIFKFEKGIKLYELDFDEGVRYSEITVDDNIDIKEYNFVDGSFTLDSEDEHENNDYILKDGSWIKKVDSKSLAYTLNGDGTITIPDDNLKVTLLNQKDISNEERFIPGLERVVKMPDGAKVSFLGFKALKDEYRLDHPLYTDYEVSYSSVSDIVSDRCDLKDGYMSEDGKVCNADTLKGITSNGGKWEIKKVGDVKILQESIDDEVRIYSMVNGVAYEGRVQKVNADHKPQLEYNDIAMGAIKSAIIESYNTSSSTTIKQQPDNQIISYQKVEDIGLKAAVAGKTFFMVMEDYDNGSYKFGIETISFDKDSVYEKETEDGIIHKFYADGNENRFANADIHPDGAIGTSYDYFVEETPEYIGVGGLGQVSMKLYRNIDDAQKDKEAREKSYKEKVALHSELGNKFIGQFLNFEDGSYIKSIFFGEEKASMRTSDDQEWQGSWSVEGDTVTINDDSGAKIYINFEKPFTNSPYDDLKQGDSATYEIDPDDSDHIFGKGELLVQGVAL